MKKQYVLFFLLALFYTACQDSDLTSSVEDSSISKTNTEESFIPFADSATLAEFANDKSVINYNMARKLALIELDEAGFREEQNWEGYRLSQKPVVVYGFDSKPVCYEFTVQDAEGKNIINSS